MSLSSRPPRRQRSGQLRVRMPAGLHDGLVRAAIAEGVSLNQFIVCVLAGSIGWSARDTGTDTDEHVWAAWGKRIR